MRQLTAGLAIMALAVAGCAATATTSSGGKPAAAGSHGATAAAGSGGTGSAGTGLNGLRSIGAPAAPGLAQWVVHGTFERAGHPAQPLSGVVTFREATSGHTTTVTVGTSGKFSLGLAAGTYTAAGQTSRGDSPCSAAATVTVRAGALTRVSLLCKGS